MARPPLEVADILNQHGDAFLARHRLSRGQLKVIGAIRACRTAALGGHVARCEGCDHVEVAYNSCRNRHCPKCQGQVGRHPKPFTVAGLGQTPRNGPSSVAAQREFTHCGRFK